jgi:glycogen operon protein
MGEGHWKDASATCFGLILDGRAQPSGIKRRGTDQTLLMVMNAYHDVVKFKLPEVPEGRQWVLLVDTNNPALSGDVSAFGAEYLVTGRSLLLLLLERRDAPARAPRRSRQKRRGVE